MINEKKIVDFRAKFWRDPTFGPLGQSTKKSFGTKTHIFEKFETFCVQWNHFKLEIPIRNMFNLFFLTLRPGQPAFSLMPLYRIHIIPLIIILCCIYALPRI